MITFWLYYCGKPLIGILAPKGTDHSVIRLKALAESALGLCDRPFETPYERNIKIRGSEVREAAPVMQ